MRGEAKAVVLGWREWIALPDLDIPGIKAKLDTGARTSALHTYFIEPFSEKGVDKVRFGIHPLRRRLDVERTCVADLVDRREVIDSGGHRELRCVIETMIKVGDATWKAEISLTNREGMLFRMLLGRSAMVDRIQVDPAASYVCGKSLARVYRKRKPTKKTKGK